MKINIKRNCDADYQILVLRYGPRLAERFLPEQVWQNSIEVLPSVIEPELGLLQVQVKSGRREPVELHEPGLGKGPKGLDAIYMVPYPGELVLAVLDAIMLFVTQVHQTVIAHPSVRVDHTLGVHPSPDDGLQSGLGAIGHDLGVDPATPLQDAEDWSFAICASSPFSFYPPCSEVELIDLDLSFEGRLLLAQLGDTLTDQKKVTVDGVTV